MKRALLSIAAITTALTAAAQQQWTLKDCIDYAMQNNITLKQSKLARQTATETRRQSQAALLPSLNATTSHNVGYKPWLETGTTTISNGTLNNKVTKSYYAGSYGLSASWLVWNGNQNHNQLKIDKLSEQQAELNTQVTANSIQESITKLYVQILYTHEAIVVNEQSLEASKKNEEQGRQMVEVGTMSKAELAQLTAQRATDEYNIVEAKANLANFKLQLKQLLEITGTQPFDIAMPAASDQQALAEIPALADVYEHALAERPEIKSAELAIQSSDIQIRQARAGHLPSITLSGGVNTSTSSNNSKQWGDQMKNNFDAAAGVGVNIPIFDNRKTRTAVNKARISREQALLDMQSQQKKLFADIEGYWLDAQSNQQKFRSAQASVESQQASYNLLSEQFQLGLKNIVELMTGKANLLKAQQNRLQSKYTTILNQQLLRFYQGEPMDI